jgi:hypothetical protein
MTTAMASLIESYCAQAIFYNCQKSEAQVEVHAHITTDRVPKDFMETKSM